MDSRPSIRQATFGMYSFSKIWFNYVQGQKQRDLRYLIPEDLYSEGTIDQEVIDFQGLQRKFAVVNSELDLARLEKRSYLRDESDGEFLK